MVIRTRLGAQRYNNRMDKIFKHAIELRDIEDKKRYERHIKKHTKKENTYDPECEFCNPKQSSFGGAFG
jgi:hypothetical protein